MKTNKILLGMLAIATLSLASCSSDEPVDSSSQKMEARLELTLTGTPVNTRTTGKDLPTKTDEEKINRVVVAIFNSDGKVNIIQESTSTTDLTVKCTPGANCTGIVVANAPEKHFAGITTKTAFVAKTVDLTQTSTELPMSGEIKTTDASAASTFTLKAGETTNLAVSLSRLVARVAINSIKTGFSDAGQYSKATFKLKKIFLHNANTKSTVATGTPTVTVPLSGKVDGTNAGLQTAVSSLLIPSTAHTTPYWFYTFAHDATTPTKLVLYGEFDPDGKGTVENVYYPVVVNKFQTGTTINDGSSNITKPEAGKGDATISRNSTYLITATIKGKGVDNPDKDINPAVISLTVEVAKWALEISQDVTFN